MDITSRSTWGATYRAGFGPRKLPAAEAWLHHTVTAAPSDSVSSERAAMRTVEQIGQQRFGAGFSYNLAVMPSGRVYEGCGVGRVGAHTAGRNSTALGIVLVGNYDTSPVPAPMQKALADLLRHAHAAGWLTTPQFTGGHRDAPGASTACPGRHAYALLAAVNKAAAANLKPAPAPAPSTSQEDEDMRFKVIRKADGAVALVAPGYFRHVNGEELAVAQTLGQATGAPQPVNDREWDVARALALGSDR